VIVPAAGTGQRLGLNTVKALASLGDQPLLAWALAGVESNRCVQSVVVVTHPSIADAVAELVATRGFGKVVAVVPGGPTRRASVAAGLTALPAGPSFVAVHDACRPLMAPGAIDRLLEALQGMENRYGIAPGAPVTDTVRRVADDDCSGGIVDREDLRAIQTPQLFLRTVLEEAHRRAAAGADLDDVVLVERAGYPVAVVRGGPENLKITTPLDLLAAEALLERGALGGTERAGARP
jgi:2-C-methyl-D-erythritol 4-phosphate cytidylyltransferase